MPPHDPARPAAAVAAALAVAFAALQPSAAFAAMGPSAAFAAMGPFAAFAALAFAQSPAPAWTPAIEKASDDAKRAVARVAAPKGWEISLFAAEPRLANPVAFTIDGTGAMYVAESFRISDGIDDIRDHMDWLDEDLASRTVEDRVALLRKHLGDAFAGYTRARERVKWIADTDGDGLADADRVLDDDFHEPSSGIGAGVLAWKGDVFYTCIPDLWLLRDPKRDGTLAERRSLSRGYGVHTSMFGHDLHGLRIGPDGRLYFSIGDRGLNVETEHGRIEIQGTGAVLRCELDGSGLEPFAVGLRNPQKLVFDAAGNLFTGDNNADGGDRARWVHVLEGADYGYRYGYQWMNAPHMRGAWNEEKLWHPHFAGQAAYIVPPVAWLGSGPSGCTVDPGTGLSDDLRGHFFLCNFEGDPGGSQVLTFTLKRKGASFELGPVTNFLTGCLPTDCEIGPDGALYWTDWVSGWKATGKGRIVRAAPEGLRSRADVVRTQRLLREGMDGRGLDELAALLDDADQRVRQSAHLELAARGPDGVRALERVARGGAADNGGASSARARLHAAWGLGVAARHGAPVNVALLLRLLGDADADVRARAATLCGELAMDDARASLIERLRDDAAPVRLAAAIALGKIGGASAVDPLFALARDAGDDDPALRHGAVLGLVGCAGESRLAAAASDPSPHARVAAVVALRRLRGAGLEAFLGDADARVATEAARAVYDAPVEAALPALAARLDEPAFGAAPKGGPATRLDTAPLARRVLAANLRLGGDARAMALARFAARGDVAEPLRAEALEHLLRWNAPPNRDPISGEWRPIARPAEDASRNADVLARAAAELGAPSARGAPSDAAAAKENAPANGIDAAPEAIARLWIRLVEEHRVTAEAPRLERWCDDAKRPAKLRAAALRALETLGTAGLADCLKRATADAQADVRVAALEAIRRSAPAETMHAAETAMHSGTIVELRFAYDALASLKTAEADAALANELDRLAAGLVPQEARLELVIAAERRFGDSLARRMPGRDAARALDPELAPWLDGLHGGDAARGRALFRDDVSLACLRCHKGDDGEGGQVGPDLRGLGARATRQFILESIVAPNRRIAAGFQGAALFLKNGTVVTGRIEREEGGRLFVRLPSDDVAEIAAADVDERTVDVSAMPDGLPQKLTRDQMRDLIEYLAGLR